MTRTGGRQATTRQVMGMSALAVGMPTSTPKPGWKWVSLSEIARLESGHTPSRAQEDYWGGDIPWLSIRDAKAHHGSTIHSTMECATVAGISNSSARVLPAGTVCLSRTASVGYVVILGAEMATSQDFANWICSDAIVPRFLQYLLLAEAPSLAKFSSGSVHQTIYYPELKALHVCIPSVCEQKRIVGILDEALAGITSATDNSEKNLANAKELFSSELRQLFQTEGLGWRWEPIGKVANAQLGKMLDKSKNQGELRPYLRNMNVRWFGFDLGDLKTMRFLPSEEDRYTVKRGDLVIVEGGYPGRSAIWERDEPIFYQKAVHRVRFDDPRLAKLLMYMLFAQHEEGTLARHFTGAGIQHLTGKALGRMLMPLPPIEQRTGLVSRLGNLFKVSEKAREIYTSKLAALTALRQSLLQTAFVGDLTGIGQAKAA